MSAPISTPEWDLFLDLLSAEPNVSKAARDAGLSPSAVYARKDRDPDFALRWDEAIREAADAIEHAVHQRAVNGVRKPIYYKGSRVGFVREYSDSLAALYLKRWKPEYRERQTVDLNQAVEPMTEEEKAQAIAEIFAGVYARVATAGLEPAPPEDYDLG